MATRADPYAALRRRLYAAQLRSALAARAAARSQANLIAKGHTAVALKVMRLAGQRRFARLSKADRISMLGSKGLLQGGSHNSKYVRARGSGPPSALRQLETKAIAQGLDDVVPGTGMFAPIVTEGIDVVADVIGGFF